MEKENPQDKNKDKETENRQSEAVSKKEEVSVQPQPDKDRPGRGKIISVQGPVVDCYFKNFKDMPALYDVVEVNTVDGKKVVLQTAEQGIIHARYFCG